jgi:tetratricopeptide (TPR) repeat protein
MAAVSRDRLPFMLRRPASILRLILPLYFNVGAFVVAGPPPDQKAEQEKQTAAQPLRPTLPELGPSDHSPAGKAESPAKRPPSPPVATVETPALPLDPSPASGLNTLFDVAPLTAADGEPSIDELISLSSPMTGLPPLAPPPVDPAAAVPSIATGVGRVSPHAGTADVGRVSPHAGTADVGRVSPHAGAADVGRVSPHAGTAERVSPHAGAIAPPPPAPPKKKAPPTPEQLKLMEVARKVARSVVALRAWDGFGQQLAEGCGFFIDENGAILTDLQLVHPEFAGRIEYITVATGSGTFHRITGYWAQDPKTGLTILQSDALATPFVHLRPDGDFSTEQPVSIVALSHQNGLSLADAKMKADRTAPGEGWLNLRGEDSPGEPGSPVIDAEGRVVAVISMRVPQGQWFNFGLPIIHILPVLEQMAKSSPQPLARLGRQSRAAARDDPGFLAAFQTLYTGQIVNGTSQLLLLLKRYPRSAEVWALLGLAYSKLGAREEALNCSRKAVALDPEVGKYWQQLAMGHLENGAQQANPAAREALERTVEEQPQDKIAWLLLAEQQILARQFAEAERSLLDVIKLEPDYAPASYLLGYVKIQRGEFAEAEALLKRCLQLDRKHARGWFLLALLHVRQQRLDEAAEAYRRLVALQPTHPHAWRNLALIERQLGHDTAALQAFERHQNLGAPAK